MKPLPTVILLLSLVRQSYGQQDNTSSLFRLSVDNDALVLSGRSYDWGYTSGIRADYFYSNKKLKGLVPVIFYKIGKGRVTTKGLSLVQLIYAPKQTSLVIPSKNDYAYSGAITGIYTTHMADLSGNLNQQVEWTIGLMGPPSFAKQAHRYFHDLINDPEPKGWEYQLPADLLVNYKTRIEKKINFHPGPNKKFGYLIFSADLDIGTMLDKTSASLGVQLGDPANHFSGMMRQFFSDRFRFGLYASVSVDFVAYNALIQGGLFNSRSPVHNKNSLTGTDKKLNHVMASANATLQLSFKNWAVNLSQRYHTSELRGFDMHAYGSISLSRRLH